MNEYRVCMLDKERDLCLKADWFYIEDDHVFFECADKDGDPEIVAIVRIDLMRGVFKLDKLT